MLDGLFGSLVVRKADRVEEAKGLYDKDEKPHVIVISEWGSSILVNGIATHMVRDICTKISRQFINNEKGLLMDIHTYSLIIS